MLCTMIYERKSSQTILKILAYETFEIDTNNDFDLKMHKYFFCMESQMNSIVSFMTSNE